MLAVTEAPTGAAKRTAKGVVDVGERKLLVRAALGRRKIATLVTAKARVRFTTEYSALIRANIGAMEKKDRKGARAKASTVSASASGAATK